MDAEVDRFPATHARFVAQAIGRLREDPRIVGVGLGGSALSGEIDEWSDLDFVVAVEPAEFDAVLAARQEIAASLGPLLAAFTGEHVGEPRLLICLYGPPLLHVDLKFVRLEDAAVRVEDPCILWERDGRLSKALASAVASFPRPDLQWIEDRFWVWVHYAAGKIGRGEIFEALDCVAFLRARALGPLVLRGAGARPSGVRRIETVAPEFADRMRATVAGHDAKSCIAAVRASAELYRELRESLADSALVRRTLAERESMEYLRSVESRIS